MRHKRLTAAGVTMLLGVGVPTAVATTTATAAPRIDCSRNLPVTHGNTLVQMQAVQTCGYSYRAWGFWVSGPVDGYHYGTYRNVNGKFSVACGDSACDVGNVSSGGYQTKRTGKMICTFGCSALPHQPGMRTVVIRRG